MPGNALATEIAKEPEMLINAINKIIEIANYIQQRKKLPLEGTNSIKDHIHTSIVAFMAKYYEFSPRRYKLTELCSGCGICKKMCPIKNIELINNKPIWKSSCTYCLACFHWCSKEAIYMNNMFIKNRRKYHHPEITINELMAN